MFDKITNKDLIIAFFPCIRFENQILLAFRGDQYQDKNKDIEFLLERDMILHEELHHNYNLITKLALICLKRGLRLIIENPYSTQHYLTRYWALKPSIIDCDRSRRGDFYKKPTQYYFINIKPTTNIVMDYIEESKEIKTIRDTHDKVERSLISKEYAARFIKEFIGLEQI